MGLNKYLGSAKNMLSSLNTVNAVSGSHLGDGYDIYSHTFLGSPFDSDLPCTNEPTGTSSKLVNIVEELMESMRSSSFQSLTSASSGKIGSFKASLQYSIAATTDFSSDNYYLYLCYYRTFNSKKIDHLNIPKKIKDNIAERFNEDSYAFINNNGTHYVSNILRGFKVLAVISINTSSFYERRAVSSAFNLNYKSVTNELTNTLALNEFFEKVTLGFNSSINVTIDGIRGIDSVPVIMTLPEFLKIVPSIEKWAIDSLTQGGGEPVSVELRPYTELIPDEFSSDIRNQIFSRKRYSDLEVKLSIIRDRIIQIVGNNASYDFGNDDNALSVTMKKLSDIKSEIDSIDEFETGKIDDIDFNIELLNASLPKPKSVVSVSCTHGNWTPINIVIPPGVNVEISSPPKAQWGYGKGALTSLSGTSSTLGDCHSPGPNLPVGALVAKIENEDPIFVGPKMILKSKNGGQLKLAMNDTYYGDNQQDDPNLNAVSITVKILDPLPWDN